MFIQLSPSYALLQPTPCCVLRPAASCALRPASCALRPASCILRPASCVLRPAPYALHPASCALRPTPYTSAGTCFDAQILAQCAQLQGAVFPVAFSVFLHYCVMSKIPDTLTQRKTRKSSRGRTPGGTVTLLSLPAFTPYYSVSLCQ